MLLNLFWVRNILRNFFDKIARETRDTSTANNIKPYIINRLRSSAEEVVIKIIDCFFILSTLKDLFHIGILRVPHHRL